MPRLAALAVSSAVVVACHSGRPPVTAQPSAPAVLFLRGNVVRADGTVLPDAIVAVEGDRIARVASTAASALPSGAAVVGGPDRWIVAGLVDAHVHFFQSGGLYTRPDVVDLTSRVPYAKETETIRAALPETFRRYLRAGITSVVDFGGPMWNFEVRDLAARTPLAPRVEIAGPLLSSVSRPQLDLGDPPIVQVTDPEAARAMVRAQAARNPDFVKLWYVVPPGQTPDAWLPVARAAIDQAHALGLRVAVHATELETARASLRAGADVLVHSVVNADVDDDLVKLLKARDVPYVTTLTVFGGYARVLNREVRFSGADMALADPKVAATLVEPLPPAAQERSRKGVTPEALRNAKRLWDAGVVVVAGSDAGNIGTFHAAGLHDELALLVQAGLTPAQALAAATANAARLMSRPDLGAVEPGKTADLLLLSANPLDDVANLRRVELVVKAGVARRPDDILPRTAADVVQAQVNAYNAQDLDAFLSTYSDDAVIAKAGSGEVQTSGKAAFRERYGTMFRKFPQNRARIAERRTEGDRVVLDHEIVTGRGPDKPDPWDVGWVRYEVDGGLIRRVELP
jgi:imidazolonepropionase-like amidohydrolase